MMTFKLLQPFYNEVDVISFFDVDFFTCFV